MGMVKLRINMKRLTLPIPQGYDRSPFIPNHGYILSVFAVLCHVTYVMVGYQSPLHSLTRGDFGSRPDPCL